MRRVVVTGVGVLSAFGVGKEPFYAGLGRRAPLAPLGGLGGGRFPALPSLCAARLPDFDAAGILGRKGLRTLAPETLALLAAAALACRDTGLEPGRWQRDTVGTFVGTVFAGLGDYMEFLTDGLVHGPERVNPSQGPQTGFNAPASQLAIRFGTEAANVTMSNGRSSSLDALAYAAQFIREGRARVLLAGGVDLLSYFSVLALLAAGEAAPGIPAGGPFDAARSGAFPGEAAAILVLEDEEQARSRGARVLAEIAGAGSAFASNATGEGLAEAAERALRQALGAHRAGAVVASAGGEPRLDACEARALAAVVGTGTPVCAVKGAAGECMGAGGALGVAVAVRALAEGILPATAGFRQSEPALPPLAISRTAAPWTPAPILVHSLDPSGAASALLLAPRAGSSA